MHKSKTQQNDFCINAETIKSELIITQLYRLNAHHACHISMHQLLLLRGVYCCCALNAAHEQTNESNDINKAYKQTLHKNYF